MKRKLTALVTILSLGTSIYSSSAALATGTYTFLGNTTPTAQTGPWNLTSDNASFSFLGLVVAESFKFQDVTDINIGYDANLGGIAAGAPRVRVLVDYDNNGIMDGGDRSLSIHWGPGGSFADATIGNGLNTGNFIGNNDLGRYDNAAIGGVFYSDYNSALALVGNMRVWRVGVVIDSFGGNDRDFDINSINVNFEPVPEPTTMIAGALLLLPFGASVLRKLRKNPTA